MPRLRVSRRSDRASLVADEAVLDEIGIKLREVLAGAGDEIVGWGCGPLRTLRGNFAFCRL